MSLITDSTPLSFPSHSDSHKSSKAPSLHKHTSVPFLLCNSCVICTLSKRFHCKNVLWEQSRTLWKTVEVHINLHADCPPALFICICTVLQRQAQTEALSQPWYVVFSLQFTSTSSVSCSASSLWLWPGYLCCIIYCIRGTPAEHRTTVCRILASSTLIYCFL